MLLSVPRNVTDRIVADYGTFHGVHTQRHSTCCDVHAHTDTCPPQGERRVNNNENEPKDNWMVVVWFYLIMSVFTMTLTAVLYAVPDSVFQYLTIG